MLTIAGMVGIVGISASPLLSSTLCASAAVGMVSSISAAAVTGAAATGAAGRAGIMVEARAGVVIALVGMLRAPASE